MPCGANWFGLPPAEGVTGRDTGAISTDTHYRYRSDNLQWKYWPLHRSYLYWYPLQIQIRQSTVKILAATQELSLLIPTTDTDQTIYSENTATAGAAVPNATATSASDSRSTGPFSTDFLQARCPSCYPTNSVDALKISSSSSSSSSSSHHLCLFRI